MNLVQLRAKFRDVSGRHDLVNADDSDNGADFYINEGRKFLDRLDETQKSWASHFKFVETGGFAVHFPYCRALKEVWMMTASERWPLEKMNLRELVANYLADAPSERNTGSPAYYSPTVTRYIPEGTSAEDFEAYIGFVDIPSGTVHEYNSILLSCPVSEKVAVECKGLFYSNELVSDDDTNYWASQHPLLLILSTMRSIEVGKQNRNNVKDLTDNIVIEMRQLGMDLVEEIIAETSQMVG